MGGVRKRERGHQSTSPQQSGGSEGFGRGSATIRTLFQENTGIALGKARSRGHFCKGHGGRNRLDQRSRTFWKENLSLC